MLMRLIGFGALALVAGTACLAQDRDSARPRAGFAPKAQAPASSGAVSGPATKEEAEEFVAQAETELARMSEHGNRLGWVAATYINDDTNWLRAKLDAEFSTRVVALAKAATRFDHVDVDQVLRRKLDILKRSLLLPAPDRPGAAEELADIGVRLATRYSTAKVSYGGKDLTLEDIAELMRTSRDPNELKTLWEGWHAIATPMRGDYSRQAALANEGARALGYADTGVLWRSWYDLPPDDFARTLERLMSQVAPLYNKLQCFARARLNDKYGDAVQPRSGPIRADLLGNMWAQTWSNVYDLLAPKDAELGYDLTAALEKHGYDATRIVKTAENFYTSIGFTPLPKTFWERSMITRPRDREVDCHASAWDVDDKDDLRVKACFRRNAEDFYVAHHELGHNFYQRAYKDQPHLFKEGANDGFHEAIGDFVGLYAVSPDYLKTIGLIDRVPGPEADIPFLLRMALDKIAFLPFAYLVDKWRWQVFAGETPPERYNDGWWELRTKLQGVKPPAPRPADAFDAGAKSHVATNVPYARYFLATIYQFQFHRAACREAGWSGPLNRCSIYGNTAVGARLDAMLRLGSSKPWPQALETFTGERDIDASAILDYFAPLERWLSEQVEGEQCGW
jgi:peptidyl-dipeptidase A